MDRQTMNQVAWGGKGLSTINPFDVLPDDSIHQDFSVPYDPERAASLLKQAGATGATVPINVLVGSDQGKLEAQIIKQGFEKAGLQAPINLQQSTVWLQGLYVTRKSAGITDNFGTLPYPVLDIANYMLNPTVFPLPPKPSPAPDVYNAIQAASKAIDNATYRQDLLKIQAAYLKEAAAYLSFIAPNYQVAPNNLYGLEASEFDDQRFASAYLA
jgi:ABC-type transport system substrate-binding protein